MKSKTYCIILASGSGSRYNNDIPKQFVKIAGKTILEHTIEIFEKSKHIDEIIVVISSEYRSFVENILLNNNYKKITKLLNGGKTRKDSSYIGISSISDKEANVVIHDCVRPFLSQRIIDDCIKALETYQAVDVAIPSADTIIKVKNDLIQDIPVRSELMRGQTPQCFKLSLIKKAHELSENDNVFTDDCGLIIKHKLAEVYVVDGETENIKITYPSDIYMADRLFQIKNATFPQEIDLSNIKNKVVVIFGGTSGIGQSIADIIIANQGIVYVASSSKGVDVSSFKAVSEFLEFVYKKEKHIDYIINSAGVLKIGKLEDRNIDDIKYDIDVNYIGSINVVKAGIQYLKETQGGFLLFTSSSYTRGRALYSIYSSVKSAIVNLVQALSEELSHDGIRINVINPERTATPMRLKAFGEEPVESLLSPKVVAEVSLKTILSDYTGQVIDVRRV